MRVSDSHRQLTLLRQLSAGSAAVARANEQAVTGLRVNRFSDDPVVGRQVVDFDSTLRALGQYQRNAGAARHRLETEEGVLQQVTDLLTRAKQLATSESGSTASAATRAIAAAEIRQIQQQVIALGNTSLGGEFIFGGQATGAPPFQANGTYVGSGPSRQSELGAGQLMDTVHNGDQLLVTSGVIGALAALETALMADNVVDIRTSMGLLDGAVHTTQALLAEVGGRDSALELTVTMLTARSDSLIARRSAVAEIPLEEAVINLTSAQTALEAAYLATSRTLSLSLAGYLR
ncbi:MAG: flagellar hook-associated protein FlgL [Gemmatimonadales bacterium]|nr:flagellar hook-associated protein FlgL [Gemmatimonadales bacterium]